MDDKKKSNVFWVYENWRAEKKAVIHEANCIHCNNGHGTQTHRKIHGDKNGKWHGSFGEYGDARTFANSLKDREVRDCGHCHPEAK